jgi:predicted nucleic acid-binding protein
MRYLLDTDHASYLQRGHPAVVQHLKSLPPDAEVFISVVTQAELLTGIQSANRGVGESAGRGFC